MGREKIYLGLKTFLGGTIDVYSVKFSLTSLLSNPLGYYPSSPINESLNPNSILLYKFYTSYLTITTSASLGSLIILTYLALKYNTVTSLTDNFLIPSLPTPASLGTCMPGVEMRVTDEGDLEV